MNCVTFGKVRDESGGVGGTVPGDARADARRAGDVRRVPAGQGGGLHGVDDGERDLHRG